MTEKNKETVQQDYRELQVKKYLKGGLTE